MNAILNLLFNLFIAPAFGKWFALDTTAFNASLKEVYAPGVREQLNQLTNLVDLFTEKDVSTFNWMGREVVLDLHSARNLSGVKYIAESGGLPVAGFQGTANLKVPIAAIYGRIQLTEHVMKASRSDKGAFIRAMDLEQKGLVEDLARQRNRALAGFGGGVLAVISSGTNSTTQTVKNPGGVTGTTNATRFLQPGMFLTITDPTGVTIRGGGIVSTVTASSAQIVFPNAINTTTGDYVSLGTNSLGNTEGSAVPGTESMGVLGLADSTTYVTTIFGLDRSAAANQFFVSQVLSNVGTINEDILQRGVDNTEEVSGKTIDKFVCHVSVRREIIKLTQADRRYMGSGSPMNFDAGTEAGAFKKDLTFNSWSIRTDKDFAYGTIVGLNTDHLIWLPEDKGSWTGAEGDTILLRVPNQADFEARYRVFENFASDQGDTLLRYDGVNATVTQGTYSI